MDYFRVTQAEALKALEGRPEVDLDQIPWKSAAFVFNSPGNDVLNGYQIYKVGLKSMEPVVETPEKFKPLNFNMLGLSFDERNVGQVTALLRECRDALIRASQSTTQPTHVVFINLNSATMARAPEVSK